MSGIQIKNDKEDKDKVKECKTYKKKTEERKERMKKTLFSIKLAAGLLKI